MKTEAERIALDDQIDTERNNLRTDRVDITYGEIASMYERGELIITPEYQRLFRWTDDQKANFIESLLLGFPIPAIFVAETDKGIWELVDGLQRVSTVLEYMGVKKDQQGTPIPGPALSFAAKADRKLSQLNGFTFEELSLKSRLNLKRMYCRVEVIKVGSAPTMKYDVFERLNTGGSRLEPQEIRNAIFRASNPNLMAFFDELATFGPFADNLLISDAQQASMFDRGLVLRFLTLKNNYENFDHDVEPFVTSYVKAVVSEKVPFDGPAEKQLFERTFSLVGRVLGDGAWRWLKNGEPKGQFSTYIFDAISVGVANNIGLLEHMDDAETKRRCNVIKGSDEFKNQAGAGGNTQARMRARMQIADRVLREGQ
ncbi:DUF262 domain-containing protein [Bradyrhizobium yuanmingense]|uniref:DUF262 domain-containing protein n=1 Tax=Bradyrhizobium yuanmingense TaxID=108015 RepID=UPI003519A118